MAEIKNNCFLVNAPAGSGKTTRIRAQVKDVLSNNPNDNILCITYTNRAADELSKGFATKNIFVGTIHSFLNSFMKQYFSHSGVLALFFEVYGDKINERIQNAERKDTYEQSNNKYIEKYGEISFEIIKNNIHELYYNESSYNSLYYGGLSHDDLISFSKIVFDRYPILLKRISSKYQYIFIDEYQDTMADVLKIFYKSVVDSDSKLYLFGDKMQQIYKNYDGSFEDEFKHFNTELALHTNYRSTKAIVDILNNIYNDKSFVQEVPTAYGNTEECHQPTVIFSSDVENTKDNLLEKDNNTLVLYLFNKSRFAAIGAPNLYIAFSHMERYSFEQNCAAILTSSFEDNPDPLLKLLYCLLSLSNYYKKKQYGLIIQTIRANSPGVFRKYVCDIKCHDDKLDFIERINKLFQSLDSDISISEFLDKIKSAELVNETLLEEILSVDDFKSILPVSISEPKCVFDYLSEPKVSTQHGVKGESHDSVIFVADDSSTNPIVHMYSFFEMWAKVSFSIKEFNDFYYSYLNELSDLQKSINMKIDKLNSDTFKEHETTLVGKATELLKKFGDNPYFNYLCKEYYTKFLARPGATNAKSCFKESKVYGIFSAYKLFYVGCSRARKKLTVLIDSNKIKGDIEAQKKNFEKLGFDVHME